MSNGKHLPPYKPAGTPPPRKPQCDGKVLNEDQQLRRCTKDGLPVNVTGSFGSQKQNLCMRCVKLQRERGWKITFQLEGDAAACPE